MELCKELNLSELFKEESLYNYQNENVVITHTLEILMETEQAIRMNFFSLIYCIEGYIQLNIGEKEYLIENNHLCFIFPTTIISKVITSKKHKLWCIGVSPVFFNHVTQKDKLTDNTIAYIHKHPVRQLSQLPKTENIIQLITNAITKKIADKNEYYKNDVINLLLSALFCELLAESYQLIIEDFLECKNEVSQRTLVFRTFIKEMSKDNGKHRSISYYANKLCYSPKYISSCIKEVSGRSAMEWITEHTIELIKHQLKYTTLTIKEISNEFDFPNASFFGKYVKKQIGMSPGKYREAIQKGNEV